MIKGSRAGARPVLIMMHRDHAQRIIPHSHVLRMVQHSATLRLLVGVQHARYDQYQPASERHS